MSSLIADESFTLGLSEGNFLNTDDGSLTGTLIAGHEYRLYYNVNVYAWSSADTALASGSGFLSLSFDGESGGTGGSVPSLGPLSVTVLCGLLGFVGTRRLRD
jgi:hypothetical protein